MLYFREECKGGVLFDSTQMSFALVERIPFEFKGIRIPSSSAHERKDILSAPIAVYYELLNGCNLSCRHCFACSSEQGGQRLSTKQSISLIEHLHDIGVINLRVTGGEPTCHPDWVEILQRAKTLGLVLSLQTNGVYEDIDKTVRDIHYLELDQISVSLDGAEEAHDWLRGKGSYEKFMAAVKAMNAAGIALRFNTILHRRNFDELRHIFEMVSQYGMAINFFFLRPVGRALKERDLFLSRQEHFAAGRRIDEMAQDYPALKVFHSAAPATKRGQSAHMPYGMTVLCVAHDGTIWPLQYLRYQSLELSAGRYPRASIDEVWSNSEMLETIRQWQYELGKRCQECEQYGMPCPGIDPEIEIAVQLGNLERNAFCTNPLPAPLLSVLQSGN